MWKRIGGAYATGVLVLIELGRRSPGDSVSLSPSVSAAYAFMLVVASVRLHDGAQQNRTARRIKIAIRLYRLDHQRFFCLKGDAQHRVAPSRKIELDEAGARLLSSKPRAGTRFAS
jgi:hypothetical protein